MDKNTFRVAEAWDKNLRLLKWIRTPSGLLRSVNG